LKYVFVFIGLVIGLIVGMIGASFVADMMSR